MRSKEYSFIDVLDYGYRWRWLFLCIMVLSVIFAISIFNFLPKDVQVSTATTIYPEIPGMTTTAVSAELSERMGRNIPGAVASGSGYTMSVPPELVEKTAKIMARTIEGYQADLRARLVVAKEEAEAEYKKNPLNGAVYASLDKFKMFPDTIKLISHTESVRRSRPTLWNFLLGFVVSGFFGGVLISGAFTILKQWRNQKRE